MLSTQKILLILLVFVVFWYMLNKYFKSGKLIEGNRCPDKVEFLERTKQTWCSVKNKCVSVWGEKCDAEA